MAENGRDSRYRRQRLRIILIGGIAAASILYTKAGQRGTAAAGNEETAIEESRAGEGDKQNPSGSLETQPEKKILPVPFLSQNDYPTGCESVTAVMALQYAGVDVSVDDFIDQYLRIGTYYEKDGEYYGNSPYYYFIGDPRTGSGFGCFAPVIYDALAAAAGEDRVKDLTGTRLKQITEEYIGQGIPVIVWATIDMQPTYEGNGWTILETGKYFTWPAEEHCLLLVGWDEEYYYFNDPNQDGGVTGYEKTVAEQRYLEMGSQALAVLPADNGSPEK